MKKNIICLLTMLCFATIAFADDKADVTQMFEKYVNAANSYSTALPSYYIKNAKIIRVVNKKQGGQQSVVIPYDRYVKELNLNSKLAKLVGYKNNYVNRKIVKVGNDYKVSATRIPRNDKTGLPSYFVFTKANNVWKIKEESMTTNRQEFLTRK